MKKILIGFYLTIFSVVSQAQVLKAVKVDSLITVSLPAEFQKRDTLGQTIYSGTASLGYIIVIKAPNPPGKVLKKEKDLNKVFKEYIKKLKNTAGNQATILNDKDTIVNNVEVRDFKLSTTDETQGEQIRRFRILYTKPATYTFQYVYPLAREDIARKEGDAFFKSIVTAPSFDGTDQYTMYGKFTGMHAWLKITLGVVILIILIVLVIVLRNRKKRED